MVLVIALFRFGIKIPLKRLKCLRGMEINLRSRLIYLSVIGLQWLCWSNPAYFVFPVCSNLCQQPHSWAILKTRNYERKGKAMVGYIEIRNQSVGIHI